MVSGSRASLLNGKTRDEGKMNQNGDLESGGCRRRRDPRSRFRDLVGSVIQDGRRDQMKKKLLNGLKSDDLEKFRKSQDELKAIKDKKIRKFYEEQNERLNDWLQVDTLVRHLADDVLESFDPQDRDGDGIPDDVGPLKYTENDIELFLPQDEREKRQRGKKYARWAININVIANILLLAAKVFAVFSSSSLSLIASLTDSALDLLCTMIIWSTNKLVAWKISSLSKRFPIGRRRLEPLGILVFSVIMVISFLQILKESFEKLLPSAPHKVTPLPLPAILAQGGTILLKGVIWIGMYKIESKAVQALCQDCKTDVIFNTLSLLFPLIGEKAGLWWLDPAGAGLLSLYIIYDWASTCLENVSRLTGIGVDDAVLKKLMYLTWRFSPIVDGYKNITAYHAGEGVWVEVDLLLNEKTPLEYAHDVAETMQYCLEGLDEVDRAFVSCDYRYQNPHGHAEGA